MERDYRTSNSYSMGTRPIMRKQTSLCGRGSFTQKSYVKMAAAAVVSVRFILAILAIGE